VNQPSPELRKKLGIKKKYYIEMETCELCGGNQFYVVFGEFKPIMVKEGRTWEKGVEIPTDVSFYCVNDGTQSSGVGFNQDIVEPQES
jgi:hypothetical protein